MIDVDFPLALPWRVKRATKFYVFLPCDINIECENDLERGDSCFDFFDLEVDQEKEEF